MNWISEVVRPKIKTLFKREAPDNLWIKCPETGQVVFHKDVEANQWVIPGSNHHMISEGRMTFATFLACPTERHALKQGDMVADLRRLSDDHAHAVVDEKSLADLGRGVDLDTGQPAGYLGDRSREKGNLPLFQPTRQSIGEQCMESGVGEDDFHPTGGGRVSVKNHLQVL